jgi:hypothetical protein
LAIGILGFAAFIIIGSLNTLPWPASGPSAVVFLGLAVGEIREYFQTPKSKSTSPADKTPTLSPPNPQRIWAYLTATAAFGAVAIISFIFDFSALTVSLGSLAVISLLLLTRQIVSLSQQAEASPRQIASLLRQVKEANEAEIKTVVSAKNPQFEDAPLIEPQSFKTYSAYLSKGDFLTIEAGTDDWIRVELVSLTESAKLELGKRHGWRRGKEGKNLTVEYEAERNGNWNIYVFNLAKTALEVGVTLTVER